MSDIKGLTFKQRFEKKYKIVESGCWEWQCCKDNHGYGFCYGRKYGTNKAHRLSYILFKGEIEKGLLVCHHCDNPGCINPEHLFLGTKLDNQIDAQMKGRRPVKKHPSLYSYTRGCRCEGCKLISKNYLETKKRKHLNRSENL